MSDFDYSKHLPVLRGIKSAFEKFQHYKDMNARVKTILQEFLPGYTISLQVEKKQLIGYTYTLRVWGLDIDYNHPVYLVWSDKQVDGQKWIPGFLEALQVADVSDSLEREAEERKHFQTFALINSEVEALIRKARSIVESMPEPTCATIRSGHNMWKGASSKLRKEFPLLFDTELPTKE